ncbi:MAG TPA: trypsin-like peptidase domain-containing protein [Candidatus Polarisedimenticolaceae bacterium]|nr:trypsin-like peptidase domain-containing protein [Candidatus Polarisedimenticolaceae bacterium]
MNKSWIVAASLVTAPALAQDVVSVAELFKRVKDSVVVIRTQESAPLPGTAVKVSVGGVGSGVLISTEGTILTAAHVVNTAETILVEMANGQGLTGRVVAAEPDADIALVRLEHPVPGARPAVLGDSDRIDVGDAVIVVGAPLGITHSLSVGHVGGRRRQRELFGTFADAELFQTDAAINRGNSGGPMFDMQGQVIGVVTSILSRSGGSEGIGFAVTSNTARRLVLEPTPWTGLTGLMLSGDLARALNLPAPVGMLVQRVVPGSPAERLGLLAGNLPVELEGETVLLGGDVILEVDGIPLARPGAREAILRALRTRAPGQALPVVVLRAGQRLELTSPGRP